VGYGFKQKKASVKAAVATTTSCGWWSQVHTPEIFFIIASIVR